VRSRHRRSHQRKELERLCRYITRPAIANERLKRNGAGEVVLQLKSAWRDGTTHIQAARSSRLQRFCNGPDDPARPALARSGQSASK